MARAASTGSAADFLPAELSLPAAASCKGCHLWQLGTQSVFGEGSADAEVMFVGEQPGDQEDKEGRPFVGPAGRVLDEALVEAGIDRSTTYMTNAVKHFKWQARGKRRIHQKPNWTEMTACRPWLEAELAVVKPRVLVLLGATAAQSLLGRQFRVTQQRGQLLERRELRRVRQGPGGRRGVALGDRRLLRRLRAFGLARTLREILTQILGIVVGLFPRRVRLRRREPLAHGVGDPGGEPEPQQQPFHLDLPASTTRT